MSRSKYTFTVFTPTYNRAHTLTGVYDSLRSQTCRDFEWLIVDDGSTDGTRRLVDQWRASGEFPIRYIYQENQGKHVAHNRAVSESRGEFVLPLDSDDACVPQALARFKHHWNSIPDNEKELFSGVTALCMDKEGRLVGTRFLEDVTDSNSLEAYYKHHVRGEKWGFQRTMVLRQFPMPGSEVGRSYMPEGLIWWRIARQYKTRYVNEMLRIYSTGNESLSSPRRPQDTALGAEMQYRMELNCNIDYLRSAPVAFLRSAAHLSRFSLHLSRSPVAQWRALTNWWGRGLWLVALPVGIVAYLRDRWVRARSWP
jgi:glycosyltransferase involved in cell wall biosynthesis